jgi:hypothetical protein
MTLSYYPTSCLLPADRTSNMLGGRHDRDIGIYIYALRRSQDFYETMVQNLLKIHSLQENQKQHTPFESDLLTLCESLVRKLEAETESSTRYWHEFQNTQKLLYSACNQHSIEKEQLITQIEGLLLKLEQLSAVPSSDEWGA